MRFGFCQLWSTIVGTPAPAGVIAVAAAAAVGGGADATATACGGQRICLVSMYSEGLAARCPSPICVERLARMRWASSNWSPVMIASWAWGDGDVAEASLADVGPVGGDDLDGVW
jgi:hypothetical protein